MEHIDSIRLALIGESDVGKSHYGAQLLSRIETETCGLKMRSAPSDLSPFEQVRTQLNAGLPASHTPFSVYRESIWPVLTPSGEALDLTWPDYGGEQIRQLIDARRMGHEWLERIQSADGWILMVRPSLAKQDDDIFSKPLGDLPRPNGKVDVKPQRSVQARLVELLQMLLHARRLDASRPLPALVVLMSCWDELSVAVNARPTTELRARLPLLFSFITTRWSSARFSIFGLSALGTALSSQRANDEFINRGPEHFGYVIDADGSRTNDLTLPILRVAELTTR